MYGFLVRPKWIAFHLLVFGLIALMIWLAFWQLHRLDARRAFNARVTEQITKPPVPLDDLLASGADPAALEWRQVTLDGTYLPDQVIWYNRSQDGLAGDNVLTAFAEDNGRTVVVNRGFVLLDSDVTAPPSGQRKILARVREPQVRQRGELTDSSDSSTEPVTEVRRIDLGQLAAQLPGDVAPVYVDLIDSIPAITDAEPVPVLEPTLDEGPHLSYAMQWFIFAAAAMIGWVLAIRRSIGTRREAAVTDATVERAPPDSVPSTDDVRSSSST